VPDQIPYEDRLLPDTGIGLDRERFTLHRRIDSFAGRNDIFQMSRRALERMSRRVTRDNPLAGGEKELQRNYDGFCADFREFMLQVESFVDEFDFTALST